MVVEQYDAVAARQAGARVTPAMKTLAGQDEPGQRTGDCRFFVGSVLYLARASRPDISCAAARLARTVDKWPGGDKAHEKLVGYLRATASHALRTRVGARGLEAGLWLDLWVGADHAGGPQRRSTSGRALFLRGEKGTHMPLGWSSRGQDVVALERGS